MKWIYLISYLDGKEERIVSTRLSHPQPGDRNLIVYVNEHGHDGRFDEIGIPLVNVRRYSITEAR